MVVQNIINNQNNLCCYLAASNNISLANSVFTQLPFNGTSQTTFDPNGWHSNTVNPTRITVPYAGLYQILGGIRPVDGSSGTFGTDIYRNGTGLTGGYFFIGDPGRHTGSFIGFFSCSANDYLELSAYQFTGAALGTSYFTFQVIKVG